MSGKALLHPTRVLTDVVAQHASEAAFLWHLRNSATESPRHSRADLLSLSQRLRAHLEGLRVAGEDGWTLVTAEHKEGNNGAVFACAATAVLQQRLERFEALLAAQIQNASSRRQLVGALTFLPSSVSRLKMHLREETDAEPLWFASVAVTVLGPTNEAIRGLQRFAAEPGPRGLLATKLTALAADPVEAKRFRLHLVQTMETQVQAIVATGLMGDVSFVPWLVDRMRIPELARRAGEAFTNLTGISILEGGLEALPPDEEPPRDELLLPFPAFTAVQNAWAASRSQGSKARMFFGETADRDALKRRFDFGRQSERAIAALAIATSSPTAPWPAHQT